MINITLDERPGRVSEGSTIWEAALLQGVHIPVLCHTSRMSPVWVCRLCVVDVGGRVFAAACVRRCEEGMHIRTSSEQIESTRRTLTALLLADHPTPCAREQTTGDCELEALGRHYGLLDKKTPLAIPSPPAEGSVRETRRTTGYGLRTTDLTSQVIAVDHRACILVD